MGANMAALSRPFLEKREKNKKQKKTKKNIGEDEISFATAKQSAKR